MTDKQSLLAMRISIFVFTGMVLTFAMVSDRSIYDMVSSAYQVTLVGSFIPLSMGLYWKRATTQGAFLSIVLGVVVWGVILLIDSYAAEGSTLIGDTMPAQLAGLIAALVGMIVGSLGPQFMRPMTAHTDHIAHHPAEA